MKSHLTHSSLRNLSRTTHSARSLALFGLLGAGAALTACAQTVTTHGQIILPSRMAQIKPGVSTRDDVLQLLGTPSTTGSQPGTFTENRFYYITSVERNRILRGPELEKRDIVIIDFNQSNVVANVTSRDKSVGKELEPERATTRTYGQSMGFFQQAASNLGLSAESEAPGE